MDIRCKLVTIVSAHRQQCCGDFLTAGRPEHGNCRRSFSLLNRRDALSTEVSRQDAVADLVRDRMSSAKHPNSHEFGYKASLPAFNHPIRTTSAGLPRRLVFRV